MHKLVTTDNAFIDARLNYETENDGFTALHYATYYGHLEVCRLLLDWGAKVDSLNVGKDTPLHERDICRW